MRTKATKTPEAPLAYRVPDFCARIGIAKSTFWKFQAAGKIRTFSIGRRTLVPAQEVQRILEQGVGER
jgi:predicted site-specific integrase-resolvase